MNGGHSRQANVVFRVAPTEKHSIFNSGLRPTVIVLDAVGIFRKLSFQLPFCSPDERLCHERDLLISQPSNKNCCSLSR